MTNRLKVVISGVEARKSGRKRVARGLGRVVEGADVESI